MIYYLCKWEEVIKLLTPCSIKIYSYPLSWGQDWSDKLIFSPIFLKFFLLGRKTIKGRKKTPFLPLILAPFCQKIKLSFSKSFTGDSNLGLKR